MDVLLVSSSAWALSFFSKQKLISILFPFHWTPESQNHLNHLISLLLKLGCLVELPEKLEKWLVFGSYLQRFWCFGYCASVRVLRGKGGMSIRIFLKKTLHWFSRATNLENPLMYTELPLALSWAQSSVGSQVFSELSSLLLWLQWTPLLRWWLCNPHLGSRTSGCLEASILEGLLLLLLSRFSHVQLCVWPQRRQPTRLPRPWDSPGKNTGVGCHFLPQCTKVKSEKWNWNCSVVSDSSRPHGLQPTRLLRPWDFPGKSTGVGCHCLLHWRALGITKDIR